VNTSTWSNACRLNKKVESPPKTLNENKLGLIVEYFWANPFIIYLYFLILFFSRTFMQKYQSHNAQSVFCFPSQFCQTLIVWALYLRNRNKPQSAPLLLPPEGHVAGEGVVVTALLLEA